MVRTRAFYFEYTELLQVSREMIKAKFFFSIIIMTLEEFYNIFQNIKFKYILYSNIFQNIKFKYILYSNIFKYIY